VSHGRRCFAALALGLILVLWAGLPSRPARADGIPIPPHGRWGDIEMPGQKAIIVWDAERGREDLILSIQLLGQSPEAAWVVPLPSPPAVETASPDWFVQLSEMTQPRVETRYVPFPVLGAVPGEGRQGGVEVLSREQVGVYDVSVVSAERSGELLLWLTENGYQFPEAGEPILNDYVAEGWYFMATRVLPGESAQLAGDVQPLWLSFQAQRPVYPMRLTSLVEREMDILLYVLADHRMEIAGGSFEPEFAGQLQLDPVASEGTELAERLTGRTYFVTKLRSWFFEPWNTEDDLYLQQASTDEPYRRVIWRTEVSPVAICCPCYWGLGALGLVAIIGVVIRRPVVPSGREEGV
jgi:hypothetical protein